MPRYHVLKLVVAALSLAAACRNAPPSGARSQESSPRATLTPRGGAAPTSDEAKALCLADPAGDLSVDKEVRGQQERARRLTLKSDEWVAAGTQWVRKARRASDPGFYLNVDGCARTALAFEPGFVPALALHG